VSATNDGLPATKFAPAATHARGALRSQDHRPKTDYSTATGRLKAAKELADLYLELEVDGATENEKHAECHAKWAELKGEE
jgi:hypothetical protein